MSHDPSTSPLERQWARVYAACMVCLPRTLRSRHGEEMRALFVRELARSAHRGTLALSAVALAGIADVVGRGLLERTREAHETSGTHDRVALRQVSLAFVMAFLVFEAALLALSMRSRDLTGAHAAEILIFSVPFTAAMSIPMAMFVAALWHAGRPRNADADVPPPSNAGPHHRVRLTPYLGLAMVVTLLAFVMNAEIVPRANARLQVLWAGTVDVPRSDRSLTLSELRERARLAEAAQQQAPSHAARETVASYQVEIHKKSALAASCVVLTLLALGIRRRLANAQWVMRLVASVAVIAGYYAALIVGETLADQLVITPALAMWSGNILALMLALAVRGTTATRTQVVPPHMS